MQAQRTTRNWNQLKKNYAPRQKGASLRSDKKIFAQILKPYNIKYL
jgi:hypothetical protein